jgi:hypothetical protein
MLKLWLPGGMQGLAQLQERIWSQFMSGMAGAADDAAKARKPKA